MKTAVRQIVLQPPTLLDKYKGATLAVSFRQLTKNYKGAACNSGSDVAFGRDFSGLIGSSVTTWYNQSDTSNHPSQASGTSQPTINAINNKPCLRFDGINDFLTFSSLTQSGASVFAAIRLTSSFLGSFRGLFSSNNNTTSNGLMLLINIAGTDRWGTYSQVLPLEGSANTQLLSGSLYLLELHRDSGANAGGRFYLNGDSDGVFNNTESQPLAHIGGYMTQSSPVEVSELIYFPFNVGNNRAAIAQEIKKYYKI